MGLESSVSIPAGAFALLAAVGLIAVTVPVEASHSGSCNSSPKEACGGEWQPPAVEDPIWWKTPASSSGHSPSSNDQALWVHLKTDGPGVDPYQVNVSVQGGLVGSLDIFKAYGTSHKATPPSPQDYATELLPQGTEMLGGPSHLGRVVERTGGSHRTVIPNQSATPSTVVDVNSTPLVNVGKASVELPRDQEWVVVIDGRLGTDETNGVLDFSQLSFNISVPSNDGEFKANVMSIPDRPVDPLVWT